RRALGTDQMSGRDLHPGARGARPDRAAHLPRAVRDAGHDPPGDLALVVDGNRRLPDALRRHERGNEHAPLAARGRALTRYSSAKVDATTVMMSLSIDEVSL